MRIAHISDTHIRNLKYHKEYRVVFNQLYDKLRGEKPDFIVHTGDIAHTKTNLSPEFFELCSDFLKNLSSVAPLIVILGNHDGNLRNSTRQDAITPIVEALNDSNIHLLKGSQEFDLMDNFVLNVLSVFDEDNWIKPTDRDKINIALYHGSIKDSRTDIGWKLDHGECDISVFEDFDFAMLGDIHKCQKLDEKGRVWYAGSTIQQNHGESIDKGYLLWDINSKSDFSVERVILDNPKPFVTIKLTPKGRVPHKTSVPQGARVRLVAESVIPFSAMKKAIDVAKKRFKPESVTFLNRNNNFDEKQKKFSLIKENLRDITVQEKLIEKYLKEFNLSEEELRQVFELNKKYDTLATQNEEVLRNINWKLNKFEWDNLFNYGTGNSIDLAKQHGIIGIFGENYSGKSSFIDSILFTLFNTTSKNNRKNLNVINQNKPHCYGELDISIGSDNYKIQRTAEKYTRRLKGEITLEAKTNVEFASNGESLNGLSRNDTDKNIRKLFGTIDDFLLTSMSSQLDSLSYIREGSTGRKEKLAKFLDLEVFDRKFKIAKEDVADIKVAIKRLEGRDFGKEIETAEGEMEENALRRSQKDAECVFLSQTIEGTREALKSITERLEALPDDIIDIVETKGKFESANSELEELKETYLKVGADIESKKKLGEKIEEFLNSFDLVEYADKKNRIEEFEDKLRELNNAIRTSEQKVNTAKNKITLLKEVPCGSEFSHCKFIRDAYEAKANLEKLKSEVGIYHEDQKEIQDDELYNESDKIFEHIEKYEKVALKRTENDNQINRLKLKREKLKNRRSKLQTAIKELKEAIDYYEENEEAIVNLSNLLKEKKQLEGKLRREENEKEACDNEIKELYKKSGSSEQKVATLRELKAELNDLRNEYSAFDLFLRCMHSNGISYDIIKEKLPVINQEISKVLANIVDFEVFFEEDEKKLNILIKHHKHDPRPIEMASGAEKTMAAMAIRLALLNVTTLPVGDLFIMDEPATALDEKNMLGFVNILDMVKEKFDKVFLISHLDTLKDIVDNQIIIESKKGYAHIRQ